MAGKTGRLVPARRALTFPVLLVALYVAAARADACVADLWITLDARGHARFTAMVYVPKSEASLDYKLQVDIVPDKSKPAARIVSMQRVKAD